MSSSRPEYVRPLLRRLAAPPPLLSAPKHQLAGYGGVGGAADDGGVDDLFALLDRLSAGAADAAATARALAVAAEALALRAGSAGGLRSGPASNGEWTRALVLMRADRRAEAVAAEDARALADLEVVADENLSRRVPRVVARRRTRAGRQCAADGRRDGPQNRRHINWFDARSVCRKLKMT